MSIGTIGTDLIVPSDKIAYYNNLLVIYNKNDNSSLTVPKVVLDENINTKAFETLTVSTQTDQDKDETIVTFGNGSDTVFENKVIKNAIGSIKTNNITFKNCIFYNPSLTIVSETIESTPSINFENCVFVGNTGANSNGAVNITGYRNIEASFKNCTFTNTKRAINTMFWDSGASTNGKVTIEECTFNGITDEKYAALQITNSFTKIVFKNNTINNLGNAACIVRFNDGWKGSYDTKNLEGIVFDGNTVSSNIAEAKYLDLDGLESTEVDFYNAALAKFKTSLKTK